MLTKTACDRARCDNGARQKLLADSNWLYLKVYSTGLKRWIVRYPVDGKDTQQTLGTYPEMSIHDARVARDKFRAEFEARRFAAKNGMIFDALADKFLARVIVGKAKSTVENYKRWCSILKSSELAGRDISGIRRKELVAVMTHISEAQSQQNAVHIGRTLSSIFDLAVDIGELEISPAQAIVRAAGIARQPGPSRAAAINPADIATLMRALRFSGSRATARNAIKLCAYTFLRSNELRSATWGEIDVKKAMWHLPAEHMKTKRRDHYVPLSRQAIAILERQRALSGGGESSLIFPSTKGTIIESSALAYALKSLQQLPPDMRPIPTCVHGFRSTASSLLHSAGWDHYAIERQLAHADEDKVAAAYNRADYMSVRVPMMQWYADALDALRDGKPIPPKPVIE